MLVLHVYSLRIGRDGLYPFGSHDDVTYWAFAVELARGTAVTDVPTFYPVLLSWIFRITGPSLLLGKFINAVCGAGAVWAAVNIARELRLEQGRTDDTRPEHWTGALLTFWPSLVFYSTQLLKDPIIMLLGLTALWLGIRFLREPRMLHVPSWCFAVGALFFFRFYTAVVVVFSFMFLTLRFQRRWLIPCALAVALVPHFLGMGFFAKDMIAPRFNTEYLTSFRTEQYSTGGSAAGIQIDYSGPAAFLRSYGYSFATAMFGPFPWQVSSPIHAIALPEAAMMWLLAPLWLKGVFFLAGGRLRSDALLLIFSLLLIASIALFSDNIGANTRLRLLPWSAFLIYASLRLPGVRA